MGGDSLSRLRDLVEKCQAVIFTTVAKEGLGLPEFDTLIHVSGHADEFTSRQIGGGLGSGYRLIGYGSLHYGLVKGGSESMIPVRLVIDLSWLLKSVADWILSGGKIGGNFTNVRFRIDLVLRIPVKVLGVRSQPTP